jgi:hypothetical protein
MLTLLSDKEIHQLHCYLTELAGLADNLTHILLGAQTVNLEIEQPARQKPVQVSDTPMPQSQSRTRKSSRRGKGRAVLNAKKVAEIKSLLASGKAANAVAREYKVHFSTIHAIKKGRTWKEIQPVAAKPLEIMEIRK